MNKPKKISLTTFFYTSAVIALLTIMYKFAPDWFPEATLNVAKDYVEEKMGVINFKLSLGLVPFFAGTLGFLFTEHSIYKERNVSLLRKAISALQVSGGVFCGWGFGLLLYVLLSGKYEQIFLGIVLLSCLTLCVFYPILVAEQIIVLRHKTRNSLFPIKREVLTLKYLSLVALCGGGTIFFGVLFWGW